MERRIGLTRRTPIKRQSAKKKQELRETEAIRYPYIDAGLPCQCCVEKPAEHPHEITAGAHRHRAIREPDAQLYVCASCHEWIQGRPYALQIAIATVARIQAVNRCHGSKVVSIDKVLIQLKALAGSVA